MQNFKATFLRIFIYAVIVALEAQMIFYDAGNIWNQGKYTEQSLTEWSQVGLLAITILLMVYSIRFSQSLITINLAIAGFFSMALIREFDMFLDRVFDGLWQLLVYSIMALTAYFIYRNREHLSNAIKQFLQSVSFGFFLSGFLITFIFSRLYGREEFWKAVMEDGYQRSVKNVSEESIELLGYTMILFGAVEWLRNLYKQKRTT